MRWTALISMFLLAQTQAIERQGPFTIAGQTFTLVVNQTTPLLEIRDASGAVQYQKSIPSTSVSARLVSGGGLAGLLVRYFRGGEESWQIFRLKDGKLALLDLAANPAPAGFGAFVVARGVATARSDDIELKVWTGNFYVTVPARVNWQQGFLMKGEQCFEGSGNGGLVEKGCDMRVEAVRKPITTDVSFVRLLQEPGEGFGYARHLVLKKTSKIEYLGARGIVNWTRNGDEIQVRVSDVWLKALIDNNDENLGWIHTQEDFSAVGLPAGNAAP